MSHVGKVTIEDITQPRGIARNIRATVNIGGSLVDVDCDSHQVPELAVLVAQLDARLVAIAVETVQASWQHDAG